MTGIQLKKFRLSLRMSQTEFGTELGFPNPQIQISQLENGRRKITLRLIKTIERWHDNVQLERKIKKQELDERSQMA